MKNAGLVYGSKRGVKCCSHVDVVHALLVTAQSARLRERPVADEARERANVLMAHIMHDQA